MDILEPTKNFIHRHAHVRIKMNGIDKFDVVEFLRKILDGFTNILKSFAKIFTPVSVINTIFFEKSIPSNKEPNFKSDFFNICTTLKRASITVFRLQKLFRRKYSP